MKLPECELPKVTRRDAEGVAGVGSGCLILVTDHHILHTCIKVIEDNGHKRRRNVGLAYSRPRQFSICVWGSAVL